MPSPRFKLDMKFALHVSVWNVLCMCVSVCHCVCGVGRVAFQSIEVTTTTYTHSPTLALSHPTTHPHLPPMRDFYIWLIFIIILVGLLLLLLGLTRAWRISSEVGSRRRLQHLHELAPSTRRILGHKHEEHQQQQEHAPHVQHHAAEAGV